MNVIFNIKKNISIIIIISLFFVIIFDYHFAYASRTLWPGSMNLYNENISIDNFIPSTATASNSKKGFLFTGDPREVFSLGLGHIAINVTLSGKGHTFIQYLKDFKKRGLDITLILINDKAPVNTYQSEAPGEYKKPYCYLIDFYGNDGEWQLYNFKRIVEDYYQYVDNWIIGNEINGQMYGFTGPMSCVEYTKVVCKSFKDCYDLIKEKNEDADIYLSFDQCWDMPTYDKKSKEYNSTYGPYRYNAKEQLEYVNNLLGQEIDWGIALHPYPAPVESAKFWDDEYAGFDENAKEKKDRPYLITLKNFEVAIEFLAQKRFLKKNNEMRNIIISEFGLTSHDGEEIQAAALYYLWEKIRDNPFIKFFLYNAQTDVGDGYHFGLTSDKKKKRLIWAVFKDMDRIDEFLWCKDLLDRVLLENGYKDENGIIVPLPIDEEDDSNLDETEQSKSKIINTNLETISETEK